MFFHCYIIFSGQSNLSISFRVRLIFSLAVLNVRLANVLLFKMIMFTLICISESGWEFSPVWYYQRSERPETVHDTNTCKLSFHLYDIINGLRDQRQSMIQTPVSTEFSPVWYYQWSERPETVHDTNTCKYRVFTCMIISVVWETRDSPWYKHL